MPLLIYITCATPTEAERIATRLLDQRLVACVNIPQTSIRSLYLWRGTREESEETLLIAKTMEDRFTELCLTVRSLHSYETPCIVALPLAAGDAAYLQWIEESTRPDIFA